MSLPQYQSLHENPSIVQRIRALLFNLPSFPSHHSNKRSDDDSPASSIRAVGRYGSRLSWSRLRSGFNLPNLCILVWIVTLLWGERWIFESSLAACEWKNWERWPKAATPHHIALLADPQIVDPHTYIGRPWPLSKLTEMHTDNYMRRSFVQLQKHIHPDTAIFLGDMFDGGREWTAKRGSTDDPSFVPIKRPAKELKYASYWKKKFGDAFWMREYFRFGDVFFNHWNDFGSYSAPGQRGRKLITGLPGNHDFGFGSNVRLNARERFETFFGETNRVDVIGNHTFVSIDGLSLSARSIDHPDTKQISKPVEDFLDEVQVIKRRAVARELKYLAGQPEYLQHTHAVFEADNANDAPVQTFDGGEGLAEFPSILLTHVPLYRDPGAACGSLRERSPPASPPVKPDLANGIPISQGYQYQNVLGAEESLNILKRVGGVVHAFSGDDHDYCELTHIQARGGFKEITSKTISWSMGVRKPAYLLLSLWNPVDASGESIGTRMSGHGAHLDRKTGQPLTIETHLCHLPDQISIFIRYLILFGMTLVVIIARSVLGPIYGFVPFSAVPPDSGLLLSSISTFTNEPFSNDYEMSNTTSSKAYSMNGRIGGTRNRSGSVTPVTQGYGFIPQPTSITDEGKRDDDYATIEAGYGTKARKSVNRPLTKAEIAWRDIWTSVYRVAWVVTAWYLWLAWNG